MKANCLEFSFAEMKELAALIAALNANHVPYTLRRDSVAIEISISPAY